MKDLRRQLRERMNDIFVYVRMLQFVESATGVLTLQVAGGDKRGIGRDTVHVLKAGAFLHMYNAIEFTITVALERVASEIDGKVAFADLVEPWQKAWVGHRGKLNRDPNPENAISSALELCQAVARGEALKIKPKFGVGNLDDQSIEELAKRHGISVKLNSQLRATVKREIKATFKKSLGFLGVIRQVRNDLAHGTLAFSDVGKNYTAADIGRWAGATYRYLKEVVSCFEQYMRSGAFRRSPPPPPAAPPSAPPPPPKIPKKPKAVKKRAKPK